MKAARKFSEMPLLVSNLAPLECHLNWHFDAWRACCVYGVCGGSIAWTPFCCRRRCQVDCDCSVITTGSFSQSLVRSNAIGEKDVASGKTYPVCQIWDMRNVRRHRSNSHCQDERGRAHCTVDLGPRIDKNLGVLSKIHSSKSNFSDESMIVTQWWSFRV